MSQLRFAVGVSIAVTVAFASCGGESSGGPSGTFAGAGSGGAAQAGAPEAGAPQGGASGAAGFSCTPPSDCIDIHLREVVQAACCTPAYSCGYEVAPPDEEILKDFPAAADFHANLVKDDPNGKCVNGSFFFHPQEGLWKHRVEVEEGEDILITPDCLSFTLGAYILPGCCLPDNTCGLSTDESYTTLEYLVYGASFPFTKPECVSAEVLNQQFRDSVVLAGYARTIATGTCDHAALAAELPPD